MTNINWEQHSEAYPVDQGLSPAMDRCSTDPVVLGDQIRSER